MLLSASSKINLTLLGSLATELRHTLAQATDAWLSYLEEPENHTYLKACEQRLTQVGGGLRMLEISDAAGLCTELKACCQRAQTLSSPLLAAEADHISNSLAVLQAYLDFLAESGEAFPALLISARNTLRGILGEPRLRENEYAVSFSNNSDSTLLSPPEDAHEAAESLPEATRDLVRRFRQMYQIGLIGVLRSANGEHGVALMLRACDRMQAILGEQSPRQHAVAQQWVLAAAVIEAFQSQTLQWTESRRRWLTQLDRQFRHASADSACQADAGLMEEMLYLIQLAGPEGARRREIFRAYKLIETDQEVIESRHRSCIYGVDNNFDSQQLKLLDSLVSTCRELVLEASGESIEPGVMRRIWALLGQIGDRLSLVGDKYQPYLRQHRRNVEKWLAKEVHPVETDWVPLADTLLLLGGSIKTTLDNPARARSKLGEWPLDLSAANQAVLQESLGSLEEAKRALAQYSETGKDASVLETTPNALNASRGALSLLGEERAARILRHAAAFIQVASVDGEGRVSIGRPQLEALADTLVSLEFYLSQLSFGDEPDIRSLELAEDSLASLSPERIASVTVLGDHQPSTTPA